MVEVSPLLFLFVVIAFYSLGRYQGSRVKDYSRKVNINKGYYKRY